MKIWFGYGSEHSHKLVMIGHFATVDDATKAAAFIDSITEAVAAAEHAGALKVGDTREEFGPQLLDLVKKFNIYSIGPSELEQFIYDVHTKCSEKDVVIETDEIDVAAFLKVLIDRGARVEIFSRHAHPDEK